MKKFIVFIVLLNVFVISVTYVNSLRENSNKPIEQISTQTNQVPIIKDETPGVPLVVAATTPTFSDFPSAVVDTKVDQSIEVNTAGHNFEDSEIETLKNATRTNDFGGHYSVVTWGCGTQCQLGAIIDNNTGMVYEIPVSTLGTEYVATSTLLIVNPFLGEYANGSKSEGLYREFWKFDGNDFKLINSDQIVLQRN